MDQKFEARLDLRVGIAGLLAFLFLLSGCRSRSEYNPFVDMGSYDTVVIEDFEGPGNAGYSFAERVARSLARETHFRRILRESPETAALRIRGRITRYSRGNPAMRLRYGHNIGNARFSAAVRIEDSRTGDFVASLVLNETYDQSKDRERVHQNLDTLMERAAVHLAEEIREWVDERGRQNRS